MKAKTAFASVIAALILSRAAYAVDGNAPFSSTDTNSIRFIQPFVRWMTDKEMGEGAYWIEYTLVSNKADGLASYSHGALSYLPATTVRVNGKSVAIKASLYGASNQFFSDRTFFASNGYDSPLYCPFNPFKPDKLGLSLDPSTGRATLTLSSWGSMAVSFDTMADPLTGALYGFGQLASTMPRQMFIISLQKRFLAVPR